MMKLQNSLKRVLLRFWPLLFLFITWLLVVKANYTPNTWLSGWDNLHPEFNSTVNIKRSISTVWQEYQGVGLLGGMGHGADLVRQLLISVMLIFTPASLIRYSLNFLMLLFGIIGMYVLSHRLISQKKKLISQLSGLVAAIFYLFNLGTVQNFYASFEPFYWFWGCFPWLLWSVVNYLENPSRKTIFTLGLIHLIATPIGYLQTAFVVYLIFLGIFLIGWLIQSSYKTKLRPLLRRVKQGITLGITILLMNAFWLLPVIFFTITSVGVTVNAKINSIDTHEKYWQAQAFTSIESISQLKGYWFDLHEVDENNSLEYMMEPWRKWDSENGVVLARYTLFSLIIIGALSSVVISKKYGLGLLLGFALVIFMLKGSSPPLGWLVDLLRENVPLFSQIFRNVFTKWIVPTTGLFAVLLGMGGYLLLSVLDVLPKYLKYWFVTLVVIGVMGLSVFSAYPILKGQLFYDRTQLQFPQEYFSLFEYFKQQPKEKRIAFFPTQTFWGWNFYNWGYRGSGFLWYGIEQPILDRAFDVWSQYNETFYNEFSWALYNKDTESIRKVIAKYNVSYVLLDKSVIFPGRDEGLLHFEEMEQMLSQMGIEKSWEQGSLSIYNLDSIVNQDSFVFTPSNFSFIDSRSEYDRQDELFNLDFAYIDRPEKNEDFSLPFADVTKEHLSQAKVVNRIGKKPEVYFIRDFETDVPKKLITPAVESGIVFPFYGDLNYTGNEVRLTFQPSIEIMIGNQQVQYQIPELIMPLPDNRAQIWVEIEDQVFGPLNQGSTLPVQLELSIGESIEAHFYDSNNGQAIDLTQDLISIPITKCWERLNTVGQVSKVNTQDSALISIKDASGCVPMKINEFSQTFLGQVSIEHQSSNGVKPHFCVIPQGQSECLHKDVYYNENSSSQWSKVERFTRFESGNTYWLEVVGRPLDQNGETGLIEYRNPSITFYESLSSYTVDNQIWNSFFNPKEIILEPGKHNLEIWLQTFVNDIKPTILGNNISNCDVFKRGEINFTHINNDAVYQAINNASNCDYLITNTLGNQSYLFQISGKNESGRSLRFYINDLRDNYVVLEALTNSGEFNQVFTLLNRPLAQEQQLQISLETKSFGVVRSLNKVDHLRLFVLPDKWLSGIVIQSENPTPINLNSLEITSSKKYGTFKYIKEGKLDTINNLGVLALSQGFDTGWNAYVVSSGLSEKLPWLLGSSLEQVKVNGWANGWIIDRDTVSQRHGNTNNNSFGGLISEDETPITVVIVYWPQYLQWIGFGLLGLSIAGIAGVSVWKRFNNRK